MAEAYGFGSVYMFNIWQAPITQVILNLKPLASGAMAAPVATSQPPFAPNQAVAPRSDATPGQEAAEGCFISGANDLVIQFETEMWHSTVHIPDQGEYPYNRNFFIYIAYQQLYVFDDNGANVPQPPDGKPYAPAMS